MIESMINKYNHRIKEQKDRMMESMINYILYDYIIQEQEDRMMDQLKTAAQ